MYTNSPSWTRTAVVWTVALTMSPVAALPASQTAAQAISEKNTEAIREHIDEAEDIVERLLDWRPAVSAVRTAERDAPPPTTPATTLIMVSRDDVEKLSELLAATASVLPTAATPSTSSRPRGDLRAHLEKAQEIARELMPEGTDKAVGTSGGGGSNTIEVDRTALQRLEVEIDAMELVAPRRLQ